jgi:hypothetical protein
MSLAPQVLATLQSVADATTGPVGYIMANPKSPLMRTLTGQGLIVGNEQIKEGDKIAYRVTEAGISQLPPAPASTGNPWPSPVTDTAANPAPVQGSDTAGDPPVLTDRPAAAATAGKGSRGPRAPVVVGHQMRVAELPPDTARKRGGGGPNHELYPFSTLSAPDATGKDSFFVSTTAENPEPMKRLRPAIFSANKRHKEKATGISFKAFEIAHDAHAGSAGVRVFRMA